LSLYIDDFKNCVVLLRGASRRIGQQFGPHSLQIYESGRTKPLHNSLFNLSAWASTVQLANSIKMNLLDYEGLEGESLQHAIVFCSRNRASFIDYAADPKSYDLWIEILISMFGVQANSKSIQLVDDPNWGLPPIILNRAD
jgi:hypothetical protein